jgi:hypothetical protein
VYGSLGNDSEVTLKAVEEVTETNGDETIGEEKITDEIRRD